MARYLAGGVVGFAAALAFAGAAAAADLTIATATEPSSMDPHFHNLTPNNMLSKHVFNRLISQDAKQRLKPSLATSWKPVDDTTWEFKLRDGVKWHDGSPFTAEDVKFTVERAPDVPNSPSSFGTYLKNIDSVEIIDPLTVHIKTKTVAPLTPVDLSNVAIISKKNGEGATTEDYNTGKAMIGTGPYKFVEWIPGDRIVYEKNPDYWGDPEPWDKVTVRPISNDSARVAALLAGDVDMIDSVPTTDIADLKTKDGLNLWQGVSNRVIYLHLDHDRDDSPFVKAKDGSDLGKNPLKDHKVRQAISKAINRPAIVDRVMAGVAIPAGQLLPEGFFAVHPDLKPEEYDPEAAKALLAEAGYPDGFSLTIHGPNDRYINDDKIVQAIAQMLTRVGIKSDVDTMTRSVYFKRASRGGPNDTPEFSFILVGWGAGTGEPSSPLRSLLHTYDKDRGFGASNRGRYSNPEVDALVEEALRTVDDAKREKLLQDATKIAMEDYGIIPLHYQVNTWATRDGLTYEPRTDENTIAMGVKPAS